MNQDPETLVNEMTKRMENMDAEWYKSTVSKMMHKYDPDNPMLKEMESIPAEQFKRDMMKQLTDIPPDVFLEKFKSETKEMSNIDLDQEIMNEDLKLNFRPKDEQNYEFEPIQKFDDKDLRKRLSDIEYFVTQNSGSEYPGSGTFFKNYTPGYYNCIICDKRLFSSKQKYESSYPFATFNAPIGEIYEVKLGSGDLIKASCLNCGSHLGDIFKDEVRSETNKAYVINSASLKFIEDYE